MEGVPKAAVAVGLEDVDNRSGSPAVDDVSSTPPPTVVEFDADDVGSNLFCALEPDLAFLGESFKSISSNTSLSISLDVSLL